MAVGNVNFGSAVYGPRPYGYDPKKGCFTPEQAKKDFRPGIYDPEARERTNKVKKGLVVAGVATLAAAVGLFLTKGKGIEKIKNLFKPENIEAAKNAIKNVKDNAVNIAKKVVEKVGNIFKKQVATQTNS